MSDWAPKAAKLVQFFQMADENEFEGEDPLAGVAGGATGLIERLVKKETVTLELLPTGRGKLAMQRFGHLVVRAGVGEDDLLALATFIDIGYPDNSEHYIRAASQATEIMKRKVTASAVGSAQGKGSMVPSETEAEAISNREGVSWYEIVAGGCAVCLGFVPSRGGLETIGYGGDPLDSDACTRRRKQGQAMAMTHIKAKDAQGLFDMHMGAAKSLAAQGYGMTASDVMVKCNALYRLTFAVNYPEGYLLYWARELEDEKGKRVSAKINQETLSEIMLPHALKVNACAPDMSGHVAFLRGEMAEAKVREAAMKQSMESLRAKMVNMKAAGDIDWAAARDAAGDKATKKCWKCGSTEHMSWSKECPKYRPKGDEENEEDKEKKE